MDLPQTVALAPAQRIAPLLDLATNGQDVNLLAEVAAVLAVMAQDPLVAAEIRKPCALSAMQQLRHVSKFNVTFPASNVLCHA